MQTEDAGKCRADSEPSLKRAPSQRIYAKKSTKGGSCKRPPSTKLRLAGGPRRDQLFRVVELGRTPEASLYRLRYNSYM